MATNMGRGIMAPDGADNISSSGVQEMRTLAATAAAAIGDLETGLNELEGEILESVGSKYVAGEKVRRIVATTNMNLPTQPGDLLVVIEPRRYFTDFRFDQLGSTPADWTPKFEAGPGSWTVEASPDTPSGRVMRNNNPGHVRMGLGWDVIPNDSIVEVLVKTRSVDRIADTARPTIDGGMPLSGVWPYLHLSSRKTSLVIARDGSTTEAAGSEVPHLEAGAWTYLRIRREQGRAYARSWVEGTPEPSAWDIDNGLISPLPEGWIGFQSSRNGAEVAFVSVALDGGEAPKNLW